MKINYLTIKDAAAHAGVSASTLRRWLKRGLEASQPAGPGGRILIAPDRLVFFIETHAVSNAPERGRPPGDARRSL